MEPAALHVLIVDDSPEDRLAMRRFLTIPVYTSMALPDEDLVTCTAGRLRDSVRLPYGDLRRLAGAMPLAFAEKVSQ